MDKNDSHNSSIGLSGNIDAFINNGENINVSATLENINLSAINEILEGDENVANSSSVSVGRSKTDRNLKRKAPNYVDEKGSDDDL